MHYPTHCKAAAWYQETAGHGGLTEATKPTTLPFAFGNICHSSQAGNDFGYGNVIVGHLQRSQNPQSTWQLTVFIALLPWVTCSCHMIIFVGTSNPASATLQFFPFSSSFSILLLLLPLNFPDYCLIVADKSGPGSQCTMSHGSQVTRVDHS